MIFKFIPQGTQVDKPLNGHLYLDVGNNLGLSIIDHHQISNSKKSTTRLVYENKNFIPKDADTVVLHKSPDLDCVASSFLAKYYLENETFPSFSEDLVNLIDKTDFGYETQNTVSLNSIFTFIKDSCKSDEEIVSKGHTLIEDLSSYGFDSKFVPQKYEVYKDKSIFQEELSNSSTKEFYLLNKNSLKKEKLKGLILDNPKSKLFKYWARNIGFILMIVIWNKNRVVEW